MKKEQKTKDQNSTGTWSDPLVAWSDDEVRELIEIVKVEERQEEPYHDDR